MFHSPVVSAAETIWSFKLLAVVVMSASSVARSHVAEMRQRTWSWNQRLKAALLVGEVVMVGRLEG